MTSTTHTKHTKLIRPAGGKFHRHEVAVLGAPCGTIQQLCEALAKELSTWRVGYVDADHGSGSDPLAYHRVYTDKISHHQLSYHSEHSEYEQRAAFVDADAVLVNGNHFLAQKQIVLINAKKAESLSRKLDRLTDVQAFVLDDGMDALHPFLLEHNPQFANIPTFRINQVGKIANLIHQQIQEALPVIKGLVLAGGKSTRMGTDKGIIDYHGKPQREHMADVLATLCTETYISAATPDLDSAYPVLPDTFKGLGPFGGILSAFRHDPNAAWLTVATDQPLLDNVALQQLLDQRNPSKVATCFHNPETNFPEPLITLWEPRAYRTLLNFLANGYSCARKALINSDIEELEIQRTEVLLNANTPEEKENLQAMING